MKKTCLILLLCLMLLTGLPALGESAAPITPDEAINKAMALLQNEYLQWETPSLRWTAEADAEQGRVYVEGLAENGYDAFRVFVSLSGRVHYIHNGFSSYLDAIVGDPDQMETDQALCKRLDQYALDFADQINPGSSNSIEGFERPEASYNREQRFLSVYALVSGTDGAANSLTLFVVQIKPEWRIVCYSEGIAPDNGEGVG